MDSQEKPKKKWYLRWWMIVIYVVLALSFIGSLGGSKGSSVSSSNTQTAAQPEPAITVTASKLASDYKDNQVAADAKYKDKTVDITGTVAEIGKDVLDQPYVIFETEQYAIVNRVQCYFSKSDESKLVDLAKGQKLTIRGRVTGGTLNVAVQDSQIVK